jgi:hypothetical protein
MLNHNPGKTTPEVGPTLTPTLAALLSFARHCPNIQCLTLFFDAMSPPAYNENLPKFQELRCLSVGESHLAAAGSVAMFLSRILPIACELDWFMWGSISHRDKWGRVKDTVPFLLSIQLEKEGGTRVILKKVRVLEAENEYLRAHRG